MKERVDRAATHLSKYAMMNMIERQNILPELSEVAFRKNNMSGSVADYAEEISSQANHEKGKFREL
jgi:hypothetical protein